MASTSERPHRSSADRLTGYRGVVEIARSQASRNGRSYTAAFAPYLIGSVGLPKPRYLEGEETVSRLLREMGIKREVIRRALRSLGREGRTSVEVTFSLAELKNYGLI